MLSTINFLKLLDSVLSLLQIMFLIALLLLQMGYQCLTLHKFLCYLEHAVGKICLLLLLVKLILKEHANCNIFNIQIIDTRKQLLEWLLFFN